MTANATRQITVIGAGYAGLATACGLAEFGHRIMVMEKLEPRVRALEGGRLPIYEPGLECYYGRARAAGRLAFSTAPAAALAAAELVFLAVGTPSLPDGRVDTSHLLAAVDDCARHCRPRALLVLKSTVPMGTARSVHRRLGEHGRSDIAVVSNPEFLQEGNAMHHFFHPDKVVIGARDPGAQAVVAGLYDPLFPEPRAAEPPVVCCTWETAELIKYANNALLATKVAFINEVAELCDAGGADVQVVARAIGMDGRISPRFLDPGPGFGGSCFPKDVAALVATGRQHDVPLALIGQVLVSNRQHMMTVVSRLAAELQSLAGARIGVLGLAFKAGTDDVRESPAVAIVAELVRRGAEVRVFDPRAMATVRAVLGDRVTYSPDPLAAASGSDAVVLLTEWGEFRDLDLARLREVMAGTLLLDTRNLLDAGAAAAQGLTYRGMGRGADERGSDPAE